MRIPSFLSFNFLTCSTSLALDGGWLDSRLLRRLTAPVFSSLGCTPSAASKDGGGGANIVEQMWDRASGLAGEASSSGLGWLSGGGGTREVERLWGRVSGGASSSRLGWWGGESSKPGGRLVASVSELRVGSATCIPCSVGLGDHVGSGLNIDGLS
jgi:hypothetical protein